MLRREFLQTAASGAAVALIPCVGRAQEAFPSRPMKLVVPYSAGGPTDVVGRRYAEKVGEMLGQPVIVENRTGAGGTIGSNAVAKAAPDGYTLLFGSSSSHVTSPLMLRQPPYDPLKDFTLINIGVLPLVLVVRTGLPAQNFTDFMNLLHANPGKYTFGSGGVGSINHLAGELLKMRAGVDALHVPFQGTNPAQVALMAGQIDFLFDTVASAMPQQQAGRLKIIATLSERRSASAPDIPTTIESGIPDSSVVTVNFLAMPSTVPARVVTRLVDATKKVMADPTMLDALTKMGIEPIANTDPVSSAQFVASEISRWAPIVKATGVSI